MGKRNTAFHKADIQDIERNLAETCEAERLGVTPNTASTDLFYLDPKGKVDAPHFVAERNKSWKLGELTMDRILKAQSAITIQPQKIRPAKGKIAKVVAKKVLQERNVEREKPLNPIVYDLWAKELSPTEEAFNELLPNARVKRSLYPAVPLPDAFESYHPEAASHLAHLVELEAKEHLKLARQKQKTNLKSVEKNAEEGENMVERANKELLAPHLEPSEPEDQIDASLPNKLKPRKKKTIPERNKIQMRKKQQNETLLARRKRAIAAQLNNLKHLKQHVDALQVVPLKEEKRIPFHPAPAKQVGNRRLVQAPLAIKLPEEQTGSLRLLVPELNPVNERFRNLAERALIEPTGSIVDRSRRKRLKGNLPIYKEYTKHSHKD